MGVVSLRSIGASAKVKSSRETFTFRYFHSEKEEVGRINNWGCCSGIKYLSDLNANNGSYVKKKDYCDWGIAIISKTNMPNLFYKRDFLNAYCKFMSNIFPEYVELVPLGIGGLDDDIDKRFKSLKGTGLFTNKSGVYIAFKITKDNRYARLRLMSLSFVRFLHFGRYWFYVKHIMDLRNNEDLSELSNIEILQLASYGNSNHSKESFYGLYHYKSPVMMEGFSYYIQKDAEKLLNSIKSQSYLNSAFCPAKNIHIYDCAEITDLFRKGEYVTIYNMLTEPIRQTTKGFDGTYTARLINSSKLFKVRSRSGEGIFTKKYIKTIVDEEIK